MRFHSIKRTKNIRENSADIAIVLGNFTLPITRERAIKGFELYKLGFVKKIIFSGGVPKQRDAKGVMHPTTLKAYMENRAIEQQWSDIPEGDWGAETYCNNLYSWK